MYWVLGNAQDFFRTSHQHCDSILLWRPQTFNWRQLVKKTGRLAHSTLLILRLFVFVESLLVLQAHLASRLVLCPQLVVDRRKSLISRHDWGTLLASDDRHLFWKLSRREHTPLKVENFICIYLSEYLYVPELAEPILALVKTPWTSIQNFFVIIGCSVQINQLWDTCLHFTEYLINIKPSRSFLNIDSIHMHFELLNQLLLMWLN